MTVHDVPLMTRCCIYNHSDHVLQRAAEVIFDGVQPPPPPPRAVPPEPPRREEFEVDDSEQGLLSGRRGGREFRPVVRPHGVS